MALSRGLRISAGLTWAKLGAALQSNIATQVTTNA
jgi:hypothetical protein